MQVKHALQALPGVSEVEVYLSSEKAVLQIDPALVAMPAIRQAVAGSASTGSGVRSSGRDSSGVVMTPLSSGRLAMCPGSRRQNRLAAACPRHSMPRHASSASISRPLGARLNRCVA